MKFAPLRPASLCLGLALGAVVSSTLAQADENVLRFAQMTHFGPVANDIQMSIAPGKPLPERPFRRASMIRFNPTPDFEITLRNVGSKTLLVNTGTKIPNEYSSSIYLLTENSDKIRLFLTDETGATREMVAKSPREHDLFGGPEFGDRPEIGGGPEFGSYDYIIRLRPGASTSFLLSIWNFYSRETGGLYHVPKLESQNYKVVAQLDSTDAEWNTKSRPGIRLTPLWTDKVRSNALQWNGKNEFLIVPRIATHANAPQAGACGA